MNVKIIINGEEIELDRAIIGGMNTNGEPCGMYFGAHGHKEALVEIAKSVESMNRAIIRSIVDHDKTLDYVQLHKMLEMVLDVSFMKEVAGIDQEIDKMVKKEWMVKRK